MSEIGIVVAIGVFVLLIWQVTRAQDADNRNSNSNQSSYVDSPPPGGA